MQRGSSYLALMAQRWFFLSYWTLRRFLGNWYSIYALFIISRGCLKRNTVVVNVRILLTKSRHGAVSTSFGYCAGDNKWLFSTFLVSGSATTPSYYISLDEWLDCHKFTDSAPTVFSFSCNLHSGGFFLPLTTDFYVCLTPADVVLLNWTREICYTKPFL